MSVKHRLRKVERKMRKTEYRVVVAPGLDAAWSIEDADERAAAMRAAHDAAIASYRAKHPEASERDVYVVLSKLESRL